MNFPIDYLYRLVDRGGAGLSCDPQGVTLGAAELARVHLEEGCHRRCEVRSPRALGQILNAAYGPQPATIVQRLHRGLLRTAAWLEAGELCRAGVEAVVLRVPDLTPAGLAKLAEFADLEKRGQPWEDEARIPAGQAGGGQWTTGGGVSTGSMETPALMAPASALLLPTATARSTPPYRADPAPTLDDGVYRPGEDSPQLISISAAPEEIDNDPPYRSNGPPEEVATLQEMFPGLKEQPFATAVVAPFDHFIGFSALADQMNLAATVNMYLSLVSQIKAVDPHFVDYEVFPEGGVAGLTWEGRANLINDLLMSRASAYYRIRGDAAPLQVETLKFLRKTVDMVYTEANEKYDARNLNMKLKRGVAIGQYLDKNVRLKLQELYSSYRIPYGKNQKVTVNNRDYDTSSSKKSYTIPDARVGDVSFDWTLTLKDLDTDQIRGFFRADSKPVGVVIVIPSQRFPDGAYYIPRAAFLNGK